jgi:hypothetical protein
LLIEGRCSATQVAKTMAEAVHSDVGALLQQASEGLAVGQLLQVRPGPLRARTSTLRILKRRAHCAPAPLLPGAAWRNHRTAAHPPRRFLSPCDPVRCPPALLSATQVEGFSLYEAMSAVEIGNPKMDPGFRTGEATAPLQLAEEGAAPLDLSPQQCVDVMDQLLQLEATWHTGSSLAQTIYSSLYMLLLDRWAGLVRGHGCRQGWRPSLLRQQLQPVLPAPPPMGGGAGWRAQALGARSR